MSAHCDHHHVDDKSTSSPRYRKILWAALVINFAMFAVEISAGFKSGSVSLLADAIDFFGDAANYGVSLAVLSAGVVLRARAAMLKGACMLAFGLFVLGRAAWMFSQGTTPEAFTMGSIGLLALIANVAVAAMLYAWREGDANMRSVWLCSRNDAIGNIAVMLAALGVLATSSAWPDLLVASGMAVLALSGGLVCHQASSWGDQTRQSLLIPNFFKATVFDNQRWYRPPCEKNDLLFVNRLADIDVWWGDCARHK